MGIFIKKHARKRAVKLPVAVLVCALLVVGGGIAYKAMATHTATATTVPEYVAGGSTDGYGFTVTNNGADSVYKITVSIEAGSGFTIDTSTISCPVNWAIDTDGSSDTQAVCITDVFSEDVLIAGNNTIVAFNATSPTPNFDTEYTWGVTTRDVNGGFTSDTETKTTVDVTAPVTTDDAVTGWVDSDVTVILAPADNFVDGVNGSGVVNTYYCIYNSSETACDPATSGTQGTSVVVTCGADSVCEQIIRYYSVDDVDNTETVKTSATIQIDKKAPVTGITTGDPKSGTNPTYVKSNTEFTLSATDEGSGLTTLAPTKYQIDEGDVVDYSTAFVISTAGAHTITYWSIDNVNNIEADNTLSVFIDDTEPSVGEIIIEPFYNDGTINYISGTSDISATITEEGSGVEGCEYTLDGTNWTQITEGVCSILDIDTSGATSINIRATDNVGNTGTGSAVAVTVDTNSPVFSSVGIDPASPTNNNTPTVSFMVSDDKSGVKTDTIKISDGTNDYNPILSEGVYSYAFASALADGTYTFTISASDNVGNSASDSSLAGYVIDTQDPTTTDNYGTKSGVWQNEDQKITLTPIDPILIDGTQGSGIAWTKYCLVDGCDPAGGTDYTTGVTISTEGTTYFRYASADLAGNVQDTVSRTVMIDKQDPTAGISGAPEIWTNITQTASVTCEDQGTLSGCDTTSYKYKVYTSDPSGVCSSNIEDYTSEASVEITQHSWVCSYVKDMAGNEDFSDTPTEFIVDQTPPTGELTGVPVDWQNTEATIGLTSGDTGGSGVANSYLDVVAVDSDCTYDTQYSSAVTVSAYSKACWKVVDNAGNDITGSSDILVDKIDPETIINSPDSSSWQKKNFDVGVSDSDTGGSELDKCYYRVLANLNSNANSDDSNWEYTTGNGSDGWIERTCNSTITLTVGNSSLCKYEGENTCKIQVKAGDNAGNDNWGPSYINKTRTFSIYWTDPVVTINSPDTNDIAINTLTISATVIDNNLDSCSYEFDSNGETLIDCAGGSVNVDGLGEGHHTLYFYSDDTAGNRGSDSVDFIVNNDGILTVDDDGVADFTTIQAAIAAATSGDTINVAAGDYNENIIIPSDKSGLTLIGNNKTAKILVSSGNAITVNAPVTIDGFTINCLISANRADYGIYTAGISDVVIQNNTIQNYHKNGVYVDGGTVSITGNEIIGPGSHNFSVDSIYTKGGATVSVTNNILRNNYYSGNIHDTNPENWSTAAGLSVHQGDKVTATGNTIYGNDFGIHAKGCETGGTNPVVTANSNNIYDNGQGFFYEVRTGGAPTSDYDATKNYWGTAVKATIQGMISGDVSFEPYYVDEVGGILSSIAVDTVYVDDGYSDGNAGGYTFGYNAFATIQEGIDAVAENGTVNVAAGTYNENVEIRKTLTLLGAGADVTTIEPSSGRVINIRAQEAINGFIDGVTIQGFTLRTNDNNIALQSNSANDEKYNGRNYLYKDLIVDANNNIQTAIGLFDVDGVVLDNVVVKNSARTDGGAIEMVGVKDFMMENSELTNNALGLKVFDATGYMPNQNITVTHSRIVGNNIGIINSVNGLILNAEANWWGYDSGPAHTSNTGGTGDAVSDNVDYRPWCTNADCDPIDNTAPTVSVDTLLTNDTTPALTGTVSDNVTISEVEITVIVDGKSYPANNNNDGTWILADNIIDPALGNGTYEVAVSAEDMAGNISTDGTNNELEIDTAEPAAAITSPASGGSYKGDINITATASDSSGISKVEFWHSTADTLISTDTEAPYTAIWNSVGTAEGDHAIYVKAYDNAGNIKQSDSIMVNLDRSSPSTDLTIDLADPNGANDWYTTAPTLTLDCEDQINLSGCNGIYYRWGDSGDFSVYQNPLTASEGIHTLYYYSTDKAGNQEAIQISEELKVDITDPTVALLSPLAGSTITGGSVSYISWTAGDANLGNTPIKLEYSINGGSDWHVIVENTSHNPIGEHNISEYVWTVPNLTSPSCHVKITATDLAGNDKSDSTGAFTISRDTSPTPICTELENGEWTCDIALGKNWNLISSPVVIDDDNDDIATVLSGIKDNINVVQYYESAGNWKSYIPGGGSNDLTTIEDGKGYWIYMDNPDTLTLTGLANPAVEKDGEGTLIPSTYSVNNSDWNLIGFRSVRNMNAKEYVEHYIESAFGKDYIMWKYENGTSLEPLYLSDDMKSGYGYWLFMK